MKNYYIKKIVQLGLKSMFFVVVFLLSMQYDYDIVQANTAPAMISAGYDFSVCSGNDIHGYLIWDFTDPDPGDFQKQYRVQLWKGVDETGTLLIDETAISTEKKHQIDTGIIGYGESYHFKPTTWDNAGAINNPSATNTFNLPGPAMSADFSWNPAVPEAGQTIDFFNNPGASPPYGWSWDFDDDLVEDSSLQNPSYVFASAGNYDVNLKVTHLIAGTYCEISKNVTVNPDITSPAFNALEAWDENDNWIDDTPPNNVIADYLTDKITIYSDFDDPSGIFDHKIRFAKDDVWAVPHNCGATGICSVNICTVYACPLPAGTVIKYKSQATDNILPPNPTTYSPEKSFTVIDLSVTLSANPSSGHDPLNNVDLTATVAGSATGNIRYQFDCKNDGFDTDDTVAVATYTKNNLCNYAGVGTYTARVEITRQGITATDTITITVNPPNNPPRVIGFHMGSDPVCELGPTPQADFGWNFTDADLGDTQSAYQIQISDINDFSNIIYDSGKVLDSINFITTANGLLEYGKWYYFRVSVWDNHDTRSDFIDEWSGVNASFGNFAGILHQYPTANFSYSPPLPILQFQEITFDPLTFPDDSMVYGGGTTITSFEWDFDDGTAPNPTSDPLVDGGVITHFYSEENSFTVDLKVTDSDGYACWASQHIPINTENIPIGKNIPDWNETIP